MLLRQQRDGAGAPAVPGHPRGAGRLVPLQSAGGEDGAGGVARLPISAPSPSLAAADGATSAATAVLALLVTCRSSRRRTRHCGHCGLGHAVQAEEKGSVHLLAGGPGGGPAGGGVGGAGRHSPAACAGGAAAASGAGHRGGSLPGLPAPPLPPGPDCGCWHTLRACPSILWMSFSDRRLSVCGGVAAHGGGGCAHCPTCGLLTGWAQEVLCHSAHTGAGRRSLAVTATGWSGIRFWECKQDAPGCHDSV
mmetsp:Transcript_15568/g.46990  ORF Transcript_15568/g.46990 Transcript_15568/m.46990 type:complete len:250 (-) Transcript_15568:280-1029(-)